MIDSPGINDLPPWFADKLNKDQQAERMRSALMEIREKAATMQNGGAWAAGLAACCLADDRDT
jgi:hypothetical protein